MFSRAETEGKFSSGVSRCGFNAAYARARFDPTAHNCIIPGPKHEKGAKLESKGSVQVKMHGNMTEMRQGILGPSIYFGVF